MGIRIFAILALLLWSAMAFAQEKRILHVSAYPSNSEIYVGYERPDFTENGDYVSPAALPIDKESNSVRITLFKPGFRDSTIDVTVPKLDESYLMVILQEETKNYVLDEQENAIAKRSQKSVGNWMILGSLVPFAGAAVTAALNAKANTDANDIKKRLSKHLIESENTAALKSDLSDTKKDAKNYRTATFWLAGAGAAVLAIGLYLRF